MHTKHVVQAQSRMPAQAREPTGHSPWMTGVCTQRAQCAHQVLASRIGPNVRTRSAGTSLDLDAYTCVIGLLTACART